MPRVTFDATELVGTKVDRIALVKRGANRTPFKLTKEDNEMLNFDLSKVASFLRKDDRKPGIVAVVVAKTADLDAIKEVLVKSELNVDNITEKDDLIVIAQPGISDKDAGMVKVTDDIGFLVTGLTKSFESYDFNSTSFGDVFAAGSFFPSFYTAMDMYQQTISNIMWEAKTPEEAAGMIANATAEMGQYLQSLASALPVRAFKAEVELKKSGAACASGDKKKNKDMPMEKDGDAAAETVDVEKGAGTGGEDDKKPKTGATVLAPDPEGKDSTVKEDISKNPVHGNDPIDKDNEGTRSDNIESNPAHGNGTPAASGGKQKPKEIEGTTSNDIEGSPSVTKSEGADGEAKTEPAASPDKVFADQLAELTKTITEGLASVKKEIGDQVTSLKSEVEGLQAKVAKTEEAINGTVAASPEADKTGRKVAKSERAEPAYLDTAYSRVG